jgi:hypothetical protein
MFAVPLLLAMFEVLIDIKNEDTASFPASIKSIERVLSLWRFEKSEDAPFIRTVSSSCLFIYKF